MSDVITESARRQLMSLYDGEFYKTLIEWTESQYSEVQYNCAGIIGHIAINSTYVVNLCSTVFMLGFQFKGSLRLTLNCSTFFERVDYLMQPSCTLGKEF